MFSFSPNPCLKPFSHLLWSDWHWLEQLSHHLWCRYYVVRVGRTLAATFGPELTALHRKQEARSRGARVRLQPAGLLAPV
jgi:hypothetical protein